jgi:hypothetical protein
VIGNFAHTHGNKADDAQKEKHQGNTQYGHKVRRLAAFNGGFARLRHELFLSDEWIIGQTTP